MSTDRELEALLQRTLAGRAATVTTGPAWVAADGPGADADADSVGSSAARLDDIRERRRPRWIAPTAAAAAVAAVVAGAIVVLHIGGSGGGQRTGVAAAGASCRASLPSGWRSALDAAPSRLDTTSPALTAHSTGTVGTTSLGLVTTALAADGSAQVVLITPAGVDRVLYRLSDPRQSSINTISVDGDYALVPITVSVPDPSQSSDGTTVYADVVTDLELVDLVTGTAQRLAGMSAAQVHSGTSVIDSGALLDGHAYWDVRPSFTSHQGRVLDHRIVGGATRSAATGAVSGPVRDIASVSWTGRTVTSPAVPGPLRKVVAAYNAGTVPYLATNGPDWAWIAADGRIGWSDGTTTLFRTQSVAGTPEVDGVAGPYVFLTAYDESSTVQVMDVRTGAIASTGAQEIGPIGASNGLLGLTVTPRHGGDSHGVLALLDTERLPKLYC